METEPREIEAFLTVAEELHFGRAARRLTLSTGRVSQLVKLLERRIGAPLFERTSRRVTLTAIGRQLSDGIRPAWRTIDRELARATETARGLQGTLRVGFLGATAQHIARLLEVFGTRQPGYRVELREMSFGSGFESLLQDDIEVLLTWFPVDHAELSTGPVIAVERMWLAIASDHPLATRDDIGVEDLADHAVFRAPGIVPPSWEHAHTPLHTPSGRPIRRGTTVGSVQELLTHVAAGDGVSPVSASMARLHPYPGVRYVELVDAPPLRLGVVWHTSAENNRVRALCQAAAELADRSHRSVHS